MLFFQRAAKKCKTKVQELHAKIYDQTDARKLCIKDVFIQELIELKTDLNYRDSFASQDYFSTSHILNNSMIRIAGKTIFYKIGLMHW